MRDSEKPFKPAKDLSGLKFNRLSVVECVGCTPQRNSIWKCKCDCGNECRVVGSSLVNGTITSCGCYRRERTAAMGRKTRKHGMWNTPEYKTWQGIIQRCENKNGSAYDDYGGRGIKVCERWHQFENFLADMGKRPSPEHSIDRYPNNDGHYEPGNCRWATRKEQQRNRRNTTMVELNGVSKPLQQWAEETGICVETLYSRLFEAKWDVAVALTKPARLRKPSA